MSTTSGSASAAFVAQTSLERPVLSKSGSVKRRDFSKSYSIEHGYTAHRRSLIEDAKFERKILLADTRSEQISEEMGDERDANAHVSHKLIVSVGRAKTDLARIMGIVGESEAELEHVESRPCKIANAISHDVYLEIRCSMRTLGRIKSSIKKSIELVDISVLESIDKRTELLGK